MFPKSIFTNLLKYSPSFFYHRKVLNVLNHKLCFPANFRNLHSVSSSSKVNIAVIGSGPAGFYTTQQLLKNPNVFVDIYERFPVPFGLVRFGVAPDHQEVKNVINSFTKVALNERTRFIGNINIGTDVTLSELKESYHIIVFCYGASQDALLNIPGEKLKNVISARRFVGWYNGVPQDKDLELSLECDTAVIIGQGNVALDCARILLLSTESLKNTDITNHAFTKLINSKIKKVVIIGRRGPLQAAFKIKEFRELTKMDDCHVKIDLNHVNLEFDESLLNSLPRPRKRFAELYKTIINQSNAEKKYSKECILKFFSSPVEIVSDESSEVPMVRGIRLKKNILNDYTNENGKIIETIDTPIEEIDCGLIIRSIGYRSTSIDSSLPFDAKHGIIRNESGRVVDNPGLYCSGWAAFGATGVIVNTMNASFEVGSRILQDIKSGQLDLNASKQGYDMVKPLLERRDSKVIDFIDWQRIDEYERDLGKKEGKPREKIVSFDDIFKLTQNK